MSKGLVISPSKSERQYLVEYGDEFSDDLIFNSLPCPFLNNNLCACYDFRSEACRSFPHLNKDEIVFRLMGVIGNYEICPIVFNVYEMLKRRFSWPKIRRRARYRF